MTTVDLLISVLLATCVAVQGMPNTDIIHMGIGPENYKLSFSPYFEEFHKFKQDHGKKYQTEDEEFLRFSIFVDNARKIEEHNLKFQRGESSYYMGINQFSDMTHDEFLRYNRLGKYSNPKETFSRCSVHQLHDSAPASIDWTKKGVVTPIKDQGQCGSCWAFSTTGSIEGQNAINTGSLLSFSEQQILDCCEGEYCSGCDGGLMDTAFAYINKTGGLELESDYPYEESTDACQFSRSKVRVEVVGCSDVISGSESDLKDAVGNVGPVSVAIDASHDSFQSYSGGIYDEPLCSTSRLDHGVLAVGYGSQDGTDYWLVKNSWGTSWGVAGYIKMSRNRRNQCGIATKASYPSTAAP